MFDHHQPNLVVAKSKKPNFKMIKLILEEREKREEISKNVYQLYSYTKQKTNHANNLDTFRQKSVSFLSGFLVLGRVFFFFYFNVNLIISVLRIDWISRFFRVELGGKLELPNFSLKKKMIWWSQLNRFLKWIQSIQPNKFNYCFLLRFGRLQNFVVIRYDRR